MSNNTKAYKAEEVDTFYTCLNYLIAYTARHLASTGSPAYTGTFEQPAINAPTIEERDEASRILNELWEQPSIISTYCEQNPDQLADGLLEIMRPWAFALTGIFTCVESSYRKVMCVSDDCIFEVSSLMTPIEELIGPMPALAILTLLPYKGHIVCDGRVVHISNKMRTGGRGFIDQQIAKASQQPLISTPAQLLAYTKERDMLS